MNEMCWMSPSGSDSETKVLHLRPSGESAWKPYASYPQHAVADHGIANGSKGFATCQDLLRKGWKLLPSPSAALPPR
jgi:hypothetical protein